MPNNQNQIPLFGASGVYSLRDNGFKNTAYAVAEIVDNAIQAEATKIDIYLVSKNEGGYQIVNNIIISDNGIGMEESVFNKALTFAAGTRFGSTRGLGKYGMGLPNSSVSQTKRLDVYTWQTINGNKQMLYNYLDLDEIKEIDKPFLPNPIISPDSSQERMLKLVDLNGNDSGTVVIWKDLDRVKPKTTKHLVNHLYRHLGRMFRYYTAGFDDNGVSRKADITIRVFDDNGREYDEIRSESPQIVNEFDPLFIMENTQTTEKYPDQEFNGATSEIHAEVEEEFEIDGESHPIKLIFTKFRKDVRDKIGVRNPGSEPLGILYLYRNNPRHKAYANVSLVRAHRELDSGTYGFVGDVSDNRARFWSVEVQFEAISDNVFGVDNSKQYARLFRNYNLDNVKEHGEIDQSTKVLHEISELITSNTKEMMKQLKKDATGTGTGGGIDDDDIVIDPNPVDGTGDENEGDEVTDQDRADAKAWLLRRYPEKFRDNPNLLEINVNWFLELPCKHYIIYNDLGDIELYAFKTFGDKTLIEININHPFYDRFIRKIEEKNDEKGRNTIWFLFSSMVLNEKRYLGTPEEHILKRIRGTMATNLTELMEKWFGAN